MEGELMEFYRETDVLVAGGGPSGVAAAIAAARQGASTLIVERYGRLGGAAVSNCVQPFMGRVDSAMTDELLRRFSDAGADPELIDLVYADAVTEAGAQILLHSWVFGVGKEGKALTSVQVLTKEGVLDLGATVVVDATGDGDVAFRAGVPFEKGRPGDSLLQPVTIQFRVGGVDKARAILCGGEREAVKLELEEGLWHDVIAHAIERGELPTDVGAVRMYECAKPGERVINATQVNYVDGTDVADLTRAELEGRKQALQVVAFLRRHAPGYEAAYVSTMPAAVGVRETRRFLGERQLTREDCVSGRKWDDAVVRNADFVIDIHNPTGPGQAEGFAEYAKPYDIPYGCLVPREVDGLLLAGRCISGTHAAHASYRVQKIVMAIGAAAGTAAALCTRLGVQPRHLDVRHVQRALGISSG
jgi:hypothetical protein